VETKKKHRSTTKKRKAPVRNGGPPKPRRKRWKVKFQIDAQLGTKDRGTKGFDGDENQGGDNHTREGETKRGRRGGKMKKKGAKGSPARKKNGKKEGKKKTLG